MPLAVCFSYFEKGEKVRVFTLNQKSFRVSWSRLNLGEPMTFFKSVKTVFSKYGTSTGRACRSEYWWFVLFTTIVAVVLGFLSDDVFHNQAIHAIQGLWLLATILPTIAVQARRLHDINRVGWWQLLGILPIIGWLFILIWYCRKGTLGPNRFGADPLPTEPTSEGSLLESQA